MAGKIKGFADQVQGTKDLLSKNSSALEKLKKDIEAPYSQLISSIQLQEKLLGLTSKLAEQWSQLTGALSQHPALLGMENFQEAINPLISNMQALRERWSSLTSASIDPILKSIQEIGLSSRKMSEVFLQEDKLLKLLQEGDNLPFQMGNALPEPISAQFNKMEAFPGFPTQEETLQIEQESLGPEVKALLKEVKRRVLWIDSAKKKEMFWALDDLENVLSFSCCPLSLEDMFVCSYLRTVFQLLLEDLEKKLYLEGNKSLAWKDRTKKVCRSLGESEENAEICSIYVDEFFRKAPKIIHSLGRAGKADLRLLKAGLLSIKALIRLHSLIDQKERAS